VKSMPGGRYEVLASKIGYNDYITYVDIIEGQLSYCEIFLRKSPAQ